VVSDTAMTPGEMRREQITALVDSGWEQQADGSFCKDGTRVRVGSAERERGQPALTRTISDDC
jgi:hypothetical protein